MIDITKRQLIEGDVLARVWDTDILEASERYLYAIETNGKCIAWDFGFTAKKLDYDTYYTTDYSHFKIIQEPQEEKRLMTRDQVLGFVSNTPGILVALSDDDYRHSGYWCYEVDDIQDYIFIRVDKKGNRLTEPSRFYVDLLED